MSTEPAVAGEPATAVTQQIPAVTTERCAQCTAPLAPDQRYCLQCGEPRPHAPGPPSEKAAAGRSPQVPSALGSSAGHGSPPAVPPGFPPPGDGRAAQRNNSLALIAGVGVLLLAMGVGVLIGRAGAGTAKAPPAQVISLGGGGSGASSTAPTTSTPTTPTTPKATPQKKEAKKEPKGGASISKPAPPSSAANLRSGGSGQSYEQRSKSLPNVVSTG